MDSINNWERVFGGDGFQTIFHPIDSNIFYVETQNGSLYITKDGGKSVENTFISSTDPRNWDMPVVMSSFYPYHLYTGTNKIYKSESGDNPLWSVISSDLTEPLSPYLRHNISAIHVSSVQNGLLVAGTSDGLVWLTDDDGNTWKDISFNLPRKYVSSVYFSPDDANTLYVSYTGYKDNDNTPYIYRSTDLGNTWTAIQGNMPMIAINNILALKQDSKPVDIFFVATDAGVFFTKDNSKWERLGNNMPLVTVYDVEYNPAKHKLIAGTFGRSIQTFDLRQINYPETMVLNNRAKIILKRSFGKV